jgi:hypothetical protein
MKHIKKHTQAHNIHKIYKYINKIKTHKHVNTTNKQKLN